MTTLESANEGQREGELQFFNKRITEAVERIRVYDEAGLAEEKAAREEVVAGKKTVDEYRRESEERRNAADNDPENSKLLDEFYALVNERDGKFPKS